MRLGLELLYRTTVEQNFLVGRLTRAEAAAAIGEKALAQLQQRAQESSLRVMDLNAFFGRLPKLGEDRADFAKYLESVRNALPPEPNPWA